MPNSRFVTFNWVESATLMNGTGGSAPARDETAPFVMERLQVRDRTVLYKCSASPPSPLNIDFDLGGNRNSITSWLRHAPGATRR